MQLRHDSQCIAKTLEEKEKLVFQFRTWANLDVGKFVKALQTYQACLNEAWIRVEILQQHGGAPSRHAHRLADTEVAQVTLELPAHTETTEDYTQVISAAFKDTVGDDLFAEFGVESVSDVCASEPAACAADAASAPIGRDSESGSGGAGAVAGAVIGALALCGAGAFAAMYVKKSRALAAKGHADAEMADGTAGLCGNDRLSQTERRHSTASVPKETAGVAARPRAASRLPAGRGVAGTVMQTGSI